VSEARRERTNRFEGFLGRLFLAIGFLLLSAGDVMAGTTGKLSGRVVDPEGKPVVAATITVVGTRLGAFSDADGRYNVINVPAGVHEISVTRLGFKNVTIRNITISADATTTLDLPLEVAAVTMETVIVTAERPQVNVNATNTTSTLSSEEIEALPVQELQDIVNLQAGVVDGHIRGGRREEVQFQVDGVTVNNPFDNSSTIKIDRSLLQEVQVISGTFDAEYGQAMSGVVNAVLKSGTDQFEWNGELLGGGFLFEGERRRWDSEFRPTGIQSYQLNVSGPVTANTVFLLGGRRAAFDDYLYGERRFLPTDTSNVDENRYYPTGDNERVPLGFSRDWSGLFKITNTSLPETRLSYQMLFNESEGRRANFGYRFNPEGATRQNTTSLVHGIDLTQTFSSTTFLDLSLRQNYFSYRDMAYEDLFDSRYDAAGELRSDDDYARGAIVKGVDFGRFKQKMNMLLLKTSLVSQISSRHLVKVGFEPQFPTVEFGNPGVLTNVGGDQGQVLGRSRTGNIPWDPELYDPEEFQSVPKYKPFMFAAFAQDQMEWEDLTLRAGLRVEYFDARSTVPSDPANPANAIDGAPESHPVKTTRKVALAPRLGVAYPITERAGVHFAYGHFYQYPTLKDLFSNSDYSVLDELQASTDRFDVFGNPDVDAQKTVSYEFGYKQALSDQFSAELNIFYKDIRDLLGVEFISTYNDARYARFTNTDFGNVMGFTLTLDQRRIGPLSTSLDYTWQRVRGQSSDPQETATRAETGGDPRPRLVPLNWDQRHTLNLTATLARPDEFTVSGVLKVASGQPYTPELDTGFGSGLEVNSGRKPGSFLVDLRAEKYVTTQGLRGSLFGRVFNALDTRYFNGSVFATTGSPYYSLPGANETELLDPLRFYPPRRIEIGVTLGSGRSESE
jgi:outer membrane receptor protein involved in Fe transport